MSIANNLRAHLAWFNNIPKHLEKLKTTRTIPFRFAGPAQTNEHCPFPQQLWNKLTSKRWEQDSRQNIGKTIQITKQPERAFGVKKTNLLLNTCHPRHQTSASKQLYPFQHNEQLNEQLTEFIIDPDTTHNITRKCPFESDQPHKRRRLLSDSNQNNAPVACIIHRISLRRKAMIYGVIWMILYLLGLIPS
eukprot:542472_1